jgi:beta-N-acetylhexosaminidase
MTAHVLVPAVDPSPALPATLSSDVLQGLLRGRLRYQGLITTDSLGMRAIGQVYGVPEAARMAFLAGADLLALGADPGHAPVEQRSACQRVLALAESDPVVESRLDESVRRILLVKARYGLLDWEPTHVRDVPLRTGTDDHDRISRQIAQDSITLVRNDARTLPLAADQPLLAVIPPGATGLGGYLQAYHPRTHVLQLSLNPSPEEIERILRAAEGVSVVVVGTVNARRHPGQLDLVRALADWPLVVAALDTPYDLMSFPDISTYLASYGYIPASLNALARVIVGLEKPRGHLPVALPGLYPLGYGMRDFASETAVSGD